CGPAPVGKSARPNMYLWAKATDPQTLSAPNRPRATLKAILPVTRFRLVLMLVSAARISCRPRAANSRQQRCGACGPALTVSLLSFAPLLDGSGEQMRCQACSMFLREGEETGSRGA